MKPKVYNLAAMALMCLLAVNAQTHAQTLAVPPQPPQNYSYSTGPQVYTYLAPPDDYKSLAPLYNEYSALNSSLTALEALGSQDTTYNKKMKALQQQMSELQKQMSQLRTEELKKNREDMSKRMTERNKDMELRFNQRFNFDFDRKFEQSFKTFNNLKFNFNDADLDKKVQNGEAKLKTKTYSKSYSVDRDDKLQITNMYGKITVNTWNKNEFKVDVEIKAYGDDDEKAGDVLDRISISDNKDNSGVTFTTNIKEDDSRNNNFWGTFTRNGKTSIRKAIINYTVYMPAKNPLTINNRFGGVTLPDLLGKVKLNTSYGSLTAKSLTNADNALKLQFVNASIDNLAGTDLDMQYGSLNLASANRLNANFNFTPVKIIKLNGSSTINTKYGGLQIDNLEKDARNLQVTSNFTPVKLGSVGNADFDVTVHMAGFNYDDKTVSLIKNADDNNDNNKRWTSTKNYKGHVGKGSTDRTIVIKSTYGGVKFEQ